MQDGAAGYAEWQERPEGFEEPLYAGGQRVVKKAPSSYLILQKMKAVAALIQTVSYSANCRHKALAASERRRIARLDHD